MAIKQEQRLLNLKGPLADNDLVLTRFEGTEEISRLFQFQLEMVSDKTDIKPKDIVGKAVTFSVRLADDSMRHFNGLVSRFRAGDEDDTGRRTYRAEVVPNFWFLTRHSDCRIFQDQDLKQIIEQIFSDRGLKDFDIKLKGHHPKREYCVQYRETDFDFLSRLMQQEGAWYTFVHEDGKHTMLIADKAGDYFDCGQKEVDYPTDTGSEAMEDHIRSWEHSYEFRSGKVAHSDFNFVTPSQDLGAGSSTVVDLSGPEKYELYDYPGQYFVNGDGKPFADVRMEAEEVDHDVIDGTSICRAFSPGAKFKIRQHRAKSEENKKYVLTAVRHLAHETMGYETGVASEEGYQNAFRCIPEKVNFRPARTTPKPSVQGVQTAVVIGDDEIPTEEYGRVKVRFPWDREGKGTCWCRVSQLWASAEWGGMHIPHKDDEVLVDFVDGDPDRPIIVGRVYNGERKVPLPLPDEKTKSIIRDYGDNQMIWEGKEGEQHIILEQACGNCIQMNGHPGSEFVKLQDKFGNYIMLNSPDKTISLFSPNHNSGIVLGKSVNQFSDSCGVDWKGGHSFTGFAGSTVAGTVGGKLDVFVGQQISAAAGDKASFFRGNNYDFSWGLKFTYSKNSNYNLSTSDNVVDSGARVIVDADEEIYLLGGGEDKARMKANNDEMLFTYQAAGTPRPRSTPPVPALVGTAAAAFMATASIAMAEWSDWTKGFEATDERKKARAKQEAAGTAAMNGSASVASLIGSAVACKALSNASDARKNSIVDHSAPDGSVKLFDKGVLIEAENKKHFMKLNPTTGASLHSTTKDVNVLAKNKVYIESETGMIFFVAPKATKFQKGKLLHKNFVVLQ